MRNGASRNESHLLAAYRRISLSLPVDFRRETREKRNTIVNVTDRKKNWVDVFGCDEFCYHVRSRTRPKYETKPLRGYEKEREIRYFTEKRKRG